MALHPEAARPGSRVLTQAQNASSSTALPSFQKVCFLCESAQAKTGISHILLISLTAHYVKKKLLEKKHFCINSTKFQSPLGHTQFPFTRIRVIFSRPEGMRTLLSEQTLNTFLQLLEVILVYFWQMQYILRQRLL